MKKKSNISRQSFSVTKIVSVMMMCLCLLLLIGDNFFVYTIGSDNTKNISMITDIDENESPNPVEEHSKSNQGLTIQEEYLHERHSYKDFAWLTMLLYHRVLEAEKLQIVHYELVSPPPKLA
jgi:hypothetical protein